MIRIQVAVCNGSPPSRPLYADFDELGGNIGRAEGNALVLKDPTRTISRTHASINFRNGGYRIRSLGTAMPVYVNSQPLGNGQETDISNGDEIRIGGYTMKVSPGERSVPVPDSMGPSPTPRDDPLLLFGDKEDSNPFDDLLAPPLEQGRKKARPSQGNETRSPSPTPIIPSDFDPFAEPKVSSSESCRDYSSQRVHGSDVLDLGLGSSASNQNIDDLFDLHPEKSGEPFAPDSPLAAVPGQPDTASVDPLVALGAAPRKKPSAQQAQRNDVPELHGSFRPPEAKPDPSMRAVLPKGSQQRFDVSSPEPYGMVLSWENKGFDRDGEEIKSVIVPSPGHDRRKADRRQSVHEVAASPEVTDENLDTPASKGTDAGRHPEPRAEQRGIPREQKKSVEHDQLLHAFLEGAGLHDLNLPSGLTPEFMNMLGQLLRESTQGTLDLLLARTLTKREVRAELTMIAPKENNPLKFSPTVEAALAHLLAPQGRGFMPPIQAMKDAQDDLRSHQFGFMAGMRAALAGILERFRPEELEHRLTQKAVIDSLLPFNRKAKLWDLFAERYKEISHEAEEDFHALFGREFLRAYEAQVAKLEQEKK
jgi:FHA domain-containing protein